MPKTKKSILPKNLAKYDVLIQDTNPTSTYFQVTNLPPQFTGGRNSFLLAGSSLLKNGSDILIEILDANGNTIFQNPVTKYVQGTSILISVEINENTSPGFSTIIVLGEATAYTDGKSIPPDWQNVYNVRWVTNVLVEPNIKNSSPIILLNTPTVFAEERRLYNIDTASYSTYSTKFTASLTPTMYSGHQIGYLLSAESPTTFSADYDNSYITGSLLINNTSSSLYIPITDILNSTTAFSTGQLIKTKDNRIINKLYLRSGSYTTTVLNQTSNITSSAELIYSKLLTSNESIPISYAKLRVVNLNTVSGEIYKLKVYSKVTTDLSDYKLIADVPLVTTELLITSSIRGDLSIGDFNIVTSSTDNWYADKLETSSNVLYPISGSTSYYDSINTVYPLSVTDDVLLRSVKVEIPIYNNERYAGYLSSSGYFLGTKRAVKLFQTTEYTLQFDAYYKKTSGSVNLIGPDPKVDIYIIGVNGTKIIDNNPLGQLLGSIKVEKNAQTRWYQDYQVNFNPALVDSGDVGLRFVVNNGFWHFSEISLKPASDRLFSPDEVEILIPNTEYYNQWLQHKIEFFDINNNSTDLSVVSTPTFFTGSQIDLGTLP